MGKNEHQREKRRIVAGQLGWSWVQVRGVNKWRGKSTPYVKWFVIDPETGSKKDVGKSPTPLTAWGKNAVRQYRQNERPLSEG